MQISIVNPVTKDAIVLAVRGVKDIPHTALAVDLLPTLKTSEYCDLILLFVFMCDGQGC